LNLEQQNMMVYEECRLIFATLISSGRISSWTASGLYTAGRKIEYHILTNASPSSPEYYYLEDVPWVLYYVGSWAMHGVYCYDGFGLTRSRGCINLSPINAR